VGHYTALPLTLLPLNHYTSAVSLPSPPERRRHCGDLTQRVGEDPD